MAEHTNLKYDNAVSQMSVNFKGNRVSVWERVKERMRSNALCATILNDLF